MGGYRKEYVQDVLYAVGRAWRQARASGSIGREGNVERHTGNGTCARDSICGGKGVDTNSGKKLYGERHMR